MLSHFLSLCLQLLIQTLLTRVVFSARHCYCSIYLTSHLSLNLSDLQSTALSTPSLPTLSIFLRCYGADHLWRAVLRQKHHLLCSTLGQWSHCHCKPAQVTMRKGRSSICQTFTKVVMRVRASCTCHQPHRTSSSHTAGSRYGIFSISTFLLMS